MKNILRIFFFFLYIFSKVVLSENETSVKGSLTVANLKISSKDNKENGLLFSNNEVEYKLGMNPKNELILSKRGKPLISIDDHDNLNFLISDLAVKSLNLEGIFKIMEVSQFHMIVHESFKDSASTQGWSGTNFDNFISTCGGINLLGGYGKLSKGFISKQFDTLPTHSEIRVKANFHFIDKWDNQTAYMKIGRSNKEESYIVWTDSHIQIDTENTINICGNSTGESKFISLIDIIFPHNSEKLYIEFGTNILEHDPNNISWGISNFQLYII